MWNAARKLGYGDVERRTVRTFTELGLLDHRRRNWPGRGGGSSQGSWPRQQFDLWCTLLHHRKQLIARYGHKAHIHAALCTVVVGAWLYFGEASGIPLAQVRRAMQTWAKAFARVGSYAEAQRQAKYFVRIAAHPSATNRLEMRNNIAKMLLVGPYPDREELFYQMRTLVDPRFRGEIKGPAEAPISAQNLTDMILGREAILEQLRSGANTLPDGLWEWAHFTLLWTRGWYQDAQPRLADDPSLRKHPELAQLYRVEDFESMMNAACTDLLTVLAVVELAKQATHLPPEQQPGPWLTGQLQLKVEGRQQPSMVLRPDGNRQIYLELSVQISWADGRMGAMR